MQGTEIKNKLNSDELGLTQKLDLLFVFDDDDVGSTVLEDEFVDGAAVGRVETHRLSTKE